MAPRTTEHTGKRSAGEGSGGRRESGSRDASRSTVHDSPPLEPRTQGGASRHWMHDDEPSRMDFESRGNSTGERPGDQEWGWETNTRNSDPSAGARRRRDRHAGYGDYGTREYRPRNEQDEPSTRPRDFRDYGRGDYHPSGNSQGPSLRPARQGVDVGPGGFGDFEAGPSHRGRGPRNYVRSDERIREIICERLTDDPHVDATDVTVEVKNGEVTLSGSVSERRMKHRIEDIAADCARDRDIHNLVRVTRPE